MRILIAIAILTVLALLVSSRRLWAWRRSRIGAMLTTGGWLAVLVGLMLGPRGLGAVQTEQIMVVQPLIAFFLGWVGLLIGMQLRKDLPGLLPSRTRRTVLIDVVVSMLGFTALGLGMLHLLAGEADPLSRLVIALLIGCMAVGWSSEVRSLRNRLNDDQAAGVLRATAGLSSVAAIVLYGVLFMLIEHVPPAEAINDQSVIAAAEEVVSPEEPVAEQPVEPEEAAEVEQPLDRLDVTVAPLPIGLGLSVAMALVTGVLALWLTRLAGRNESQFLVVLLAMVALLAGAATTLNYSPLFVALLGGVVAVNMPGKTLQRFQQVILEAEQPIAMAVMVVAGVLADPLLPGAVWMLVVTWLAARVLLKLPVGRLIAGGSAPKRHTFGTIRQSPIAIALAVGYAISGHAGLTGDVLTGGQLVMAAVVVGLGSDLLPLATHAFMERQRAEDADDDESVVETTDGQRTTQRPANPIRNTSPGPPEGGQK